MVLNVLLSGFGPFMNVTNNPADGLAKHIEKNWLKNFSPSDKINLVIRKELVVAPGPVDKCMKEFKGLIDGISEVAPDDKFLCLHIGVGNVSGKNVNFEKFAYNARDFDDDCGQTDSLMHVFNE